MHQRLDHDQVQFVLGMQKLVTFSKIYQQTKGPKRDECSKDI